MPVPSRGLLLTYTDVGSKLRSSAYEKWHDTEHVWPLLNLPGPLFLSATRWTAADCIAPAHLALYDLASPSAVHDPAYQELTEPDAGRGRHSILPDKLELMERRVYEPVAENDGAPVRGEPGKYMTVVEVEMKKFAEAEFNRWFDEEHIPLLARVPGWVRSRRFVLKEVLGGFGAGVKEERPPKYLALHEWTSIDVFQSREFRHATSTPWRKQVLKEDRVIEYRIRVFRVARSWGRFEA
ncbi:hypothetical protein C8T65DRAFT_586516 [Cerioporus squamosus]|nr:hypothetical protein C8T65DRAFT_586516 [Cerioporus squamosus]